MHQITIKSTVQYYTLKSLKFLFFFISRRNGAVKASLTSHRTCTYVLVTEKNRLICKGHLSYTFDFMTEYQGFTDPAMSIGMHIFFLRERSIPINAFMSQGKLTRDLRTCIPLATVARSPHSLTGFAHAV